MSRSIQSVIPIAPGAPSSFEWAPPPGTARVQVALRVWEPPGNPTNERIGNLLVPVPVPAPVVNVGLAITELRATAADRVEATAFPRPLTDAEYLVCPLVLSIVAYDTAGAALVEQPVEVRVYESPDLIREFEALAARAPGGGGAGPLMSIARYYSPLQPWVPHLRDARVLVAGCGAGGEVLAVLTLGARSVIGLGMPGEPLDLARVLTRRAPRAEVAAYAPGLPRLPACDVALCRHVVEQVAVEARTEYFTEILGKVRPGGLLLLEAPNHDCPIEPRTGVRFFHWLTPARQAQAIRYFQARGAAVPEEQRELLLLSSVQGRRNARVEEIAAALDGMGRIEEQAWWDSTFDLPADVRQSGDTLRLVIRRR